LGATLVTHCGIFTALGVRKLNIKRVNPFYGFARNPKVGVAAKGLILFADLNTQAPISRGWCCFAFKRRLTFY